MMTVDAKVNSTHYEKALLELAKEYGPNNAVNSLRQPIRDALTPVLQDVKAKTPVDSGRLRDSARLTVGRPQAPKSTPLDVGRTTNAVIQGRVGYRVSGKKGKGLRARAIAQEFGTVSRPAQPVLLTSFKSKKSRIITTFASRLDASIQKQTRLLASKQKRGKLKRR
jgi:hypothetical protein